MYLTPKNNSPLKLRFVLTPSGMETAVSFELVNYNVEKIDVVTCSKVVDICNSEGEDNGFGFKMQEMADKIIGSRLVSCATATIIEYEYNDYTGKESLEYVKQLTNV